MSHLKKLTIGDLALSVRGDHALKQELAAAAALELGVAAIDSAVLERVVQRFDEVLTRLGSVNRATYHVSCTRCDLNDVVEVENWEVSGLRIQCCTCGAEGMVKMPKAEALITCRRCGAETRIQKVDTEV